MHILRPFDVAQGSGRAGNTLIPVVAIIFAVLAAAAVVYFGFVQELGKNENANVNSVVVTNKNVNAAVNTNSVANANVVVNTNVPVNTNQATNTNTVVDPTAGWKTYTNTSIGYTVKYPPTWNIYTCPDNIAVWFGTTPIPCQSEGPGNDFVIDRMQTGFSLATTISETKSGMVAPKETTVIVGGESGTRLTGTMKIDSETMTGGGEYKDDVYVLHGGRYYHLGYFINSGEVKYATEFKYFLESVTFTK
jgi:hypothetical protein